MTALAGQGVSAAPIVAQSAPVPARTPIHFHLLKSNEYNRAEMMQKLMVSSKHKQVFQSVGPLLIAPGIASVYMHMQNAMNAYEFSLGLGKLSTLAVLIGPSIVYALNDDMWQKYDIAKNLGPEAALAPTNVYYVADSNLDLSAKPDDPNGVYQDWSAQAVLKRGGAFFVCHNATTGAAYMLAEKSGSDGATVLADFKKNLLPGFIMVPAGVAAVQQAQENGWKPFSII
ncbi:MAG TPA: hypothetical protein VFA15_00490 [Nitrososphaera sp.]|nr:hypothetical protein [Nitrososphaera sp.]